MTTRARIPKDPTKAVCDYCGATRFLDELEIRHSGALGRTIWACKDGEACTILEDANAARKEEQDATDED
jgi:hypothetical protein